VKVIAYEGEMMKGSSADVICYIEAYRSFTPHTQ